MRHGVESQGLLEQLSIELQELAGISGTGIGDDKADVEIVSGGGESPDEILPRDIDDSMLPTVTLAELNAYSLSKSSRRATTTICANSLPIPNVINYSRSNYFCVPSIRS